MNAPNAQRIDNRIPNLPGSGPPVTAMSPIHAWVLAARPKTLPAAVSPVLVGTALAYAGGMFVPLPAFAALVVALFLQIGANFANDYYDYFKGADTPERIGPTRVVASGILPADKMRTGMIVVFGAAAVAGTYLVFVGGWPLFLVGLAAMVAAVAYTGGPRPFGYYGLGDPVVFLFFGVVAVAGTYYVQTLQWTTTALLAAVPPGSLITAILVVNNLRDMESDRRAGKRTLAVILGPQRTRLEYTLLLAVAYAVPAWLWWQGHYTPLVLIPWLTFPLAARLVWMIRRARDGPTFNGILSQTARLTLFFSLLFAVGLT